MTLRINKLTASLLLGLALTGCFDRPDQGSKGGTAATPQTNANESSPPIQIKQPTEGGKVGHTEVVSGTARGIPDDQKLWVVVFHKKLGAYFPQSAPVNVQTNGEWYETVHFGNPSDKERMEFQVQVVTADGAAQADFKRYIDLWARKPDAPGLPGLPAGATPKHFVNVTRN